MKISLTIIISIKATISGFARVSFTKDKITVSDLPAQEFDKMQIALAIKNSTLEDNLSCSLLISGVLLSCNYCGLKCLCDEIDDLADWYARKTTKVITCYHFD